MPSLRRLGADAEDRAAAHLLAKGYTLVTRRFKATCGELDLIALDGETLVIVEVKWSRAKNRRAIEGVTERKIAYLKAAAEEYLHKSGEPDRRVRFDIVAIDRDHLEHHIDALRDF